jgi:isopentenyl-diphosphate delta-isomerase
MNPPETVILVDPSDRETGRMEKLAAHRDGGHLHRAFSVLLFDGTGRWLLQRRAAGKYHFPGLWTNACCSHPRPGETVPSAAARRLREELGVTVPLAEHFAFEYRADSPAEGLTEWEYDHVLTGILPPDQPLSPDPTEVAETRFWAPGELASAIASAPDLFTPWFLHIWRKLQENKELAP